MAKYRKIDPRIHNDAKYRDLSDDAKLLFLTLLTHPSMTSLGAMRHSIPGLAAEMGWVTERLSKAFREVLAKGMAEHDERASFMGLPRFLKYNPPESPNVVKSWVNSIDLIPECGMKVVLIERLKAFTEALPKAFGEAFAKSMPNQEQEQEQEQEQDKKIVPNNSGPTSTVPKHQIPKPSETDPAVLWFPVKGNLQTWPLLTSELDKFLAAYDGLDVLAECRKALRWIETNQAKRKTPKGMLAFLNRWLTKANDSGNGRFHKQQAERPDLFGGYQAMYDKALEEEREL